MPITLEGPETLDTTPSDEAVVQAIVCNAVTKAIGEAQRDEDYTVMGKLTGAAGDGLTYVFSSAQVNCIIELAGLRERADAEQLHLEALIEMTLGEILAEAGLDRLLADNGVAIVVTYSVRPDHNRNYWARYVKISDARASILPGVPGA